MPSLRQTYVHNLQTTHLVRISVKLLSLQIPNRTISELCPLSFQSFVSYIDTQLKSKSFLEVFRCRMEGGFKKLQHMSDLQINIFGDDHCVKSVRIRSHSGLHFPVFRLNTERYEVSLRIQSECGKIRTRITLNTDTFHARSG